MTTMESSGPQAPVLSPKPHDTVPEGEKIEAKSELNGHLDDAALPKAEPPSEPKSLSPLEPTPSSERQPEPATEGTETDAEKPLVNGDSSPDEQAAPNGVDATTETAIGTSPARAEEETRRSPAATATEPVAAPVSEVKEEEKQGLGAEDDKATKATDEAATSGSAITSEPSVPPIVSEEKSTEELEPKESTTEPAKDHVKDSQEDVEMTDSLTDKVDTVLPPPAEEPAVTSQEGAGLPASEVDLGPAGMSQLAIETTEKEASAANAVDDVSMVDVPSIKVAREREDDATEEEPALKRARTEPSEDAPAPAPEANNGQPDVQAEVIVSGTETPGLDSSALTKLSNWADEETNKRVISSFQRREMRRIIVRVKKTKSGGHFRDSVQKLWPQLWETYVAKVDQPMDLAELERRLRDPNGPHNTYGDFRKDLGLIFENTLSFNGPLHDITASAVNAVKSVWEEVLPIPVEEPAKPKALPKPKPIRESRTASVDARRQSTGPAAPTVDAQATKAAATQDQSADRRSSTATEGDRPKRTVRAPKSKDIDYTTKPSRKKLKPELQFAEEVLTEIMSGKNHTLNSWFMEPVDAEGLNIPDYYSIIKKPMDLNKVSRMMSAGEISSLKEFDKTVRLIFDNCYKFNGPVDQGNPVSLIAKQLENLFVAQMKGKDAWLAKYAKANAPASNASDEEDEDDEDDGDDVDGPADTKEMEELQAKLEEETKKLNGMLLSGAQALIDIQKNLVDMLQKAVIKAAQDAHAHGARAKSKSDKPKKSGKSGKSKASGTGGRKSTGGTGQQKKPGGSKKGSGKKSLTAADKDQIANAINDLEYPHLERAIDIIKKDTGQNENNDGELELDIDQLSNDALIKLWELCRKALPHFAKATAPIEHNAPAKSSSKSGAAPKPKKNKPMSAQEQEARIAQLRDLSNMYKDPQAPGDSSGVVQAPTPGAESSDDSDSEEE